MSLEVRRVEVDRAEYVAVMNDLNGVIATAGGSLAHIIERTRKWGIRGLWFDLEDDGKLKVFGVMQDPGMQPDLRESHDPSMPQ